VSVVTARHALAALLVAGLGIAPAAAAPDERPPPVVLPAEAPTPPAETPTVDEPPVVADDAAEAPAAEAPAAEAPAAGDAAEHDDDADDDDAAAAAADDDTVLLAPDELDGAAPSKLQIYGFSDMTLRRGWLSGEDSIYRLFATPEAAFAMGRLNVYIRSEPAPRLSSLLEVRLLYLPHNATTVSSTGELVSTSTLLRDDTELGGELQWGGISIQRAHLDYQLTDRLVVRVGHWLTPYGIWNVDHGSPTVIGVRRPYIITARWFPESQIGVQLAGTAPIASAQLTWAATLSNGRISAATDHDLDKAIGGRLELALPQLDELRVGASAYFALAHTATFRATLADPTDPSTATLIRSAVGSARELSLAADLRLRHGRFRLLAEWIMAQRTYQGARPAAVLPRRGGFEPDAFNSGYYVLAAWQTQRWSATPFIQIERSIGTAENTAVRLGTIGVNIRPAPTLTMKLDVGGGWVEPDGAALAPGTNIAHLEAQIAWVFR